MEIHLQEVSVVQMLDPPHTQPGDTWHHRSGTRNVNKPRDGQDQNATSMELEFQDQPSTPHHQVREKTP